MSHIPPQVFKNMRNLRFSEGRYVGARLLWLCTIKRAMFDIASYKDSDKLAMRKRAECARRWMFEESSLFNGFENICKMLGVDPEKFRKRALTMTPEDVAKIEFIERGSPAKEPALLEESGAAEGDYRW